MKEWKLAAATDPALVAFPVPDELTEHENKAKSIKHEVWHDIKT